MTDLSSVVMELMSRLKKVEEDIVNMKKQLSSSQQNNYMISSNSNITRSIARNNVINSIKPHLPNAHIRVGKKSEGTGIVIQDKTSTKKYKFYFSKMHKLCQDVSWSAILEEDITSPYDGYIFCIHTNNQYYNLIFTLGDIKNIISTTNKQTDQNNKYHFSFKIDISSNQVFETRGNTPLNVSYSLNNYSVL